MTDLKAAFLEDIRVNPADDSIRLIMADALSDSEEWTAERAELVRVQIKLGILQALGCHEGETCNITGSCSECHRDVDAEPLRKESKHLLSIGSSQQWNILAGCQWSRGFIDSFEGTWECWLRWGDGIVAEHPIRRVVLTTLPQLARKPSSRSCTLKGRKESFRAEEGSFVEGIVELVLLQREWPEVPEFILPEPRRQHHNGPRRDWEDLGMVREVREPRERPRRVAFANGRRIGEIISVGPRSIEVEGDGAMRLRTNEEIRDAEGNLLGFVWNYTVDNFYSARARFHIGLNRAYTRM